MQRQRGLTLLEMVVALVVTSLLLGFAIPAWSAAVARAHAESARVVLFDSLTRAINHATATGVEVVLCPGSRNAPLSFAVHDAARAGLLRLHTRVDERTAGFLALGLTKVGARAAVVQARTSATRERRRGACASPRQA